MADNPLSSTSSTPKVSPGELNFVDPAVEKPRMKRRTLKGKIALQDQPLPDAPKAPPAAAAPSPAPAAEPAQRAAAIPPMAAASTSPFRTPIPQSTTAPSSAASTPLYYSTGARKEKEDAPPMKSATTPFSSSSGASSSSAAARSAAASAARPATTTTSAGPSAARPNPVIDYRANIERQAREQKSVGSIINIVVGVLVALVLIGGMLSGYGAYVLTKQVHQQSVTLTDLDNRYTEQNRQLAAQITSTGDSLNDALNQAKAQIGRQQDLISRQQEAINKLLAADDKLTSAGEVTDSVLRQERITRASETAILRARLHAIENQTRFGQ